MVVLGVAGKAEPTADANAFHFGDNAGELDTVGRLVELDAVEPGVKVKMPPRAAQLAIGCEFQSDLFLLSHQAFDLAVLDALKLRPRDPPFSALGAPFPHSSVTQHAPTL